MSQFSDSLTAAIKRTGETQEALAAKAGMSRPTLSNFAGGKRTPDMESLDALLPHLGIDDRYEVALAYLRAHKPASTPSIQIVAPQKSTETDELSRVLLEMPASWRTPVANMIRKFAAERDGLAVIEALGRK